MRRGLLRVGLLAVVFAFVVGSAVGMEYHDHGQAGTTSADSVMGAALHERLVSQITVAISHANFSLNSAEMGGRLLHAHHVVNILQGSQGPNFDASKGNPGDGYGALRYAHGAGQGEWARSVLRDLETAEQAALGAIHATEYTVAGEAISRAIDSLEAALEKAKRAVFIDIDKMVFVGGDEVRIPVGTTVVWTNLEAIPHTVTGGVLDSGTLRRGDIYSYTFTAVGSIDYICAFHPRMKQRIVVE